MFTKKFENIGSTMMNTALLEIFHKILSRAAQPERDEIVTEFCVFQILHYLILCILEERTKPSLNFRQQCIEYANEVTAKRVVQQSKWLLGCYFHNIA